jgi:hypothetical protein
MTTRRLWRVQKGALQVARERQANWPGAHDQHLET